MGSLGDALTMELFPAPCDPVMIELNRLENGLLGMLIVMLQEDNKALERLTKSKEAALVEAEALLQSALEQAMSVEMVRNKNLELKRQMEICQEENRTLEKTYRQKVIEVERLTKTITELEESILASGATANAISDYQRQISELNEGKRMVERELARVKVSASRMATVAANEWKDDNDKVIPVKQWLEERRFLQGEIQRLRDKLALAERTAKAESHLKDKLSLRLKTIEECLKPSSLPERHSEVSGGKKSGVKKRSASRPRASHATKNASVLQQPHSISGNGDKIFDGKNPVQKNLSAPRGRSFSDSEKENAETNVKPNGHVDDDVVAGKTELTHEVNAKECGHIKSEVKRLGVDCEDMVSGFLYDRLQKEVLNLKGSQKDKESLLSAKDDEIKLKKTRRNAVAGGERKMLAKPADNKHHTDISERHVRQLEASEGSTA
ncbi:hypothetical protein BHM03_00044158 [Ensete ventricosum]|nr:hypothetical protein BHM03_00044158 [Ensete ventricosum]